MEWLAFAGAAAALIAALVLYRKQKKCQDIYMKYLAEKQSEFDGMLKDMEHVVEQFLVIVEPIQQNVIALDTQAGILKSLEAAPVTKQETRFSDVYQEAAAASGGLERNIRWMKAQEMLQHGVPAAEIVKRLQMSSGEIQLIDNLIKKSGQSTENNQEKGKQADIYERESINV